MSSTNSRSKRASTRKTCKSKSSTVNLECRNSLPGTSKDDMSEKYFDESSSENSRSKQPHVIPPLPLSDIIETRLKDFVTGEIDKDICNMVADDCSYKLKEIIKASTDYMLHCGRTKLTADDFNKGLFFCGENPIIRSKDLPPPVPVKKTRSKRNCTKNLEDQTSQSLYLKEVWLNDTSPLSFSMDDLEEELQSYFKAVVDVLLHNIEEADCIIANDLQTNEKIIQLVPHLVNFFSDVINKYKCDFLKISLALKFLDAFLRNPHLYFGQDSYFNILSCALLMFLTSNLPTSDQCRDCWSLKDTAGNILAFIVRRSKYQHLFFEVIYFVHSVLLTFKNSLNSHYGALVILNSIGVPAILLLLPSYIHRFHKHTRIILSSNNQNRSDFHMVKSQIVRSYYLLVDFYFKDEIKKPKFSSQYHFNSKFFLPDYLKNIKVFPILSQPAFLDYFGEDLLPSFPLLSFVSHSTYLKKMKKKKSKTKTKIIP